jgi:hypothetical protein
MVPAFCNMPSQHNRPRVAKRYQPWKEKFRVCWNEMPCCVPNSIFCHDQRIREWDRDGLGLAGHGTAAANRAALMTGRRKKIQSN